MISVFKTSVSNTFEIEALKPLLDAYLGDAKWNFDLEDSDNILRINSLNEVSQLAIQVLHDNGFDCDELSD